MQSSISPWSLIPARYSLKEWREPYDKIAAAGGFQDVTHAERLEMRPMLEEDDAQRVKAPVILPRRRGRQKRIHSAQELAIANARGGRGRGGARGGGRAGGRGGEGQRGGARGRARGGE